MNTVNMKERCIDQRPTVCNGRGSLGIAAMLYLKALREKYKKGPQIITAVETDKNARDMKRRKDDRSPWFQLEDGEIFMLQCSDIPDCISSMENHKHMLPYVKRLKGIKGTEHGGGADPIVPFASSFFQENEYNAFLERNLKLQRQMCTLNSENGKNVNLNLAGRHIYVGYGGGATFTSLALRDAIITRIKSRQLQLENEFVAFIAMPTIVDGANRDKALLNFSSLMTQITLSAQDWRNVGIPTFGNQKFIQAEGPIFDRVYLFGVSNGKLIHESRENVCCEMARAILELSGSESDAYFCDFQTENGNDTRLGPRIYARMGVSSIQLDIDELKNMIGRSMRQEVLKRLKSANNSK